MLDEKLKYKKSPKHGKEEEEKERITHAFSGEFSLYKTEILNEIVVD